MYKDKPSERIKLIASNLEFRNSLLDYISTHENLLVKESFELFEEVKTPEQFKQELEMTSREIALFCDELRDMN